MSEFLKKFKSVFIVEDEEPQNQVQETESTPQTDSATESKKTEETSGGIDKKFLEVLASALEKNNQEGFDYFEFRQSLINLSKMPMDEATRFKSAFATAQTMGVSAAQLVESVKFYLNVLANEHARFNEAHAQQRVRLIGNREEELKKLEALIQQKTAQIEQLKQEIAQHQKNRETIHGQIGDATLKIEKTKADFDATISSVNGQLEEDMKLIQQHLS